MKKTLLYIGLAVVGYAIYKNVTSEKNYGLSESNTKKLQGGLSSISLKLIATVAFHVGIPEATERGKAMREACALVQVNGKYDSKTKKAVALIQQFLKDNGDTDILRTDGVPDVPTINALEYWYNK